MTDLPSAALSDADFYRLVRSQIEFEDGLITQRLSWFVAAQSFLFTAYAITLNAPVQSVSQGYRDQQDFVYHLIPVVAIASCCLLYAAIVAGVMAQRHLRCYLADKIPADRLVDFPRIQGALLT